MPEQDGTNICVICEKPILPGAGRFRMEKGDAHAKCYDAQRGEKGEGEPPPGRAEQPQG